MSRYTTEVRNLHFNAATGQFEALVVFHEGGETRTYPSAISRPISTEFERVSRDLVVQAKARRRAGTGRLVAQKRRAGSSAATSVSDMARAMLSSFDLGRQNRAA